jgi:hypothetical protein
LKPDGEYKIRGIVCRREDTPYFITAMQLQIWQILSQEKDPRRLAIFFPDLLNLVQDRMLSLDMRSVPVQDLPVTQTLSRELSNTVFHFL